VQFAVRTVLRSRLHRMLLAFYLGIGFAVTIFFLCSRRSKGTGSGVDHESLHQVSAPLLASSIVMMGFWTVGARVVFSMPLDLRANWVFRVTPVRTGPALLQARRRSLFALAVAPMWLCSAVSSGPGVRPPGICCFSVFMGRPSPSSACTPRRNFPSLLLSSGQDPIPPHVLLVHQPDRRAGRKGRPIRTPGAGGSRRLRHDRGRACRRRGRRAMV
jgi:hypothetical protein